MNPLMKMLARKQEDGQGIRKKRKQSFEVKKRERLKQVREEVQRGWKDGSGRIDLAGVVKL